MTLKLGDKASFAKTITETDIYMFAGISGDYNSAHINKCASESGPFGERIAHGLLSAGLISTVLGTKLPGEGTIYLSQTLNFRCPVRIGDTITASATLKQIINPQKGIFRFETICTNQVGTLVIDGEAVVSNKRFAENTPRTAENVTKKTSFYSEEELSKLGLRKYGRNVLISRNAVLYSPDTLEIGNNVRIDDYTTISGNVVLGDYIHIAQFCGLYGGDQGIFMDDFSGLSSKVVIYATSNDYSGESLTNPMVPMKYKTTDKNQKVVLKKHVVVGTGSTILPGVTIETGCSVGAMSLINHSTEEFGIYVGIPAKKVKERSRKLLELEKALRDEETGGGYSNPVNRWILNEVLAA